MDCERLRRFGDSDPGIRKVSGSGQQLVVCGRSLNVQALQDEPPAGGSLAETDISYYILFLICVQEQSHRSQSESCPSINKTFTGLRLGCAMH